MPPGRALNGPSPVALRAPAPVLAAALLLVAPVLAGCLGALPGGADDAAGAGGAAGLPALLPLSVSNVSDVWPGAEPVVAAGPDGTLYVEGVGFYEDRAGPPGRLEAGPSRGVNKVFRSTDGGASWTDVTPPGPGQEQTGDGYVAVGPDGTVFAANVFGLTFQVLRSTDQGGTWVPLNVPRVPLLMHRHWIAPVGDGVVHVTYEALPPGVVPALVGGPNLEGAADHPNQGMWYTRSEDNGDTWTTPVRIDDRINYAGQSNMAVGPDAGPAAAPDGRLLYVVRYREEGPGTPLDYTYEGGTFYLLASADGGDTWETRDVFPLTGTFASAIPSITVDPAGRLYMVWSQRVVPGDGAEAIDGGAESAAEREASSKAKVHLAVSHDRGRTWTRTVLDLGNGTQAMPFAAARSPGELGLVWYEADAQGTPGEVDADWVARTALLSGASDARPDVVELRTTPWPVHEGNICVKGPACTGDDDRRLLDYPWFAFGPDGTGHAAWASTMWDRPSAFSAYGRVDASVLGS